VRRGTQPELELRWTNLSDFGYLRGRAWELGVRCVSRQNGPLTCTTSLVSLTPKSDRPTFQRHHIKANAFVRRTTASHFFRVEACGVQ
jgi:hypothetical protein